MQCFISKTKSEHFKIFSLNIILILSLNIIIKNLSLTFYPIKNTTFMLNLYKLLFYNFTFNF